MTDDQLSVVLYQIMRQVNIEVGRIQSELVRSGDSLDHAEEITGGLTALAASLLANVQTLTGTRE